MKKLILIFALIPLMAFAQYGQRGAGGGSTFYWSLTGQAQKTDSLRIIQGTNMTITQSGNTVTFNGAAGAGSTANVRANTGWTSNGTTAQDTLARVYLLDKSNIQFLVADADNDTFKVMPQSLYYWVAKDAATIYGALDTTGIMYAGSPTGTSLSFNPTSSNNPGIYFRETTDFSNDYFAIQYEGAENRLNFDGLENDAGNAYFRFLDNVDIGGSAGDPVNTLVLSSSASGAIAMRATNSSTGTTATDGTFFGIDASEIAAIWNYENTAMYLSTNNTLRVLIAAAGGVGVGATTEAQANRAKFNVLGRAANDTLAIWSNDGGGVVNDSSGYILGNGVPEFNFNGVGRALVAGSADIGDWDGDAGYAAVGHVTATQNNKALLQGGSGDTYVQSAIGQPINLRVNGTTKVSVDANGDWLLGAGVVQNNSAVSAGSDAFSGTAETDTVTISGAANTDLYWIQPTGTAAPSANDAMIVEALSTGFVVHRAASGTSGLTYNWKREKP